MNHRLQYLLNRHLAGLGQPSIDHAEDGIFTLTIEDRYLINLTADDASGEIRFFSSPGRLTADALETYWESDGDFLPRRDDAKGRRWHTSVVDDFTGVTMLELVYDPKDEPDAAFDEGFKLFIEAHKDMAATFEEEESRQAESGEFEILDGDSTSALPFGALA